ncbi:hypothetical protein AZH53_03130 [Methanomicrobiaceae archaeon CYW5]|uniref:SIR2 family protein n=1 Tax=Methanovulcanius yangii TaxID=1789227 RepID=UPI0029CA4E59|nr:SIR2 family protein [Methanovulcanius yangii]MBT8507422.1 hypothetical protein [Methanovulcanius yangii]
MDDAVIPVAYAMQASPKRYALFLGAGISLSAGLPSGKEVAADMIRKIAKGRGVAIEGNDDVDVCFQWFSQNVDGPITFDNLMKKLGIVEETRRDRLIPLILPTDDNGDPLPSNTTIAHRMIAKLVKEKMVSLIITTNFDPLLEDAIRETGVRPVIIHSQSDPQMMSIFPDTCRIVKVNGDFENLELKLTPEDLESYEPDISNYIKKICEEYGLIVCGWSADYDSGLQEILSSQQYRRYPTFWCLRPDSDIPENLNSAIKPIPIEIDSADQFFTSLDTIVERIRSIEQKQPLTVSAAIRRVTDALQQPRPDIALSQLIHSQTEFILEELAQKVYFPDGTINALEYLNSRIYSLTKKTSPLATMLATLAYFDDKYDYLIHDVVERLVNIPHNEPFTGEKTIITDFSCPQDFGECLYHLRLLPALITIYTTGIAATRTEHFNSLEAVFSPKIFKPYHIPENKKPYFESINISRIFGRYDLWETVNSEFFNAPGDFFWYIYLICHKLVKHLIPGDIGYSETYDIFEYLFGLAYLSTGADPTRIEDDLNNFRSSPLRTRVWSGSMHQYSGLYIIQDSVKTYLNGFGQKIEGTKFFSGDTQKFEICNRRFAEISRSDSPKTGIVLNVDP